MKSRDFLNQLQNHYGVDSDNKLSAIIGWDRTRISMYRTGKREFDDKTCVTVAHILGVPPLYVIGEIKAERESDPEVRDVWIHLADWVTKAAKKGQAAVWALLAVGALCTPSPTQAAETTAAFQAQSPNLYIMLSNVW